MSYSDFKTLKEIEMAFGVRNKRQKMFQDIKVVEAGEDLKKALILAQELPVKSEKAKSEMIIMPILLDLRDKNQKYFTIYSGDTLVADEEKGLKGECDFIIAKETGSFEVSYPIMQIVEAKKNDVEQGIPQCAAQMIGAKVYNEKNNIPTEYIYGCVTTGDDWLFMKLSYDLQIDIQKYYLGSIGELLGVFQIIIDEFKRELK